MIHNFNGVDGARPYDPVVFDNLGNLYGTTSGNSTDNYGSVFELSPGSNGLWTEHLLHAFTLSGDGVQPYGGLALDNAGYVYGTTCRGGKDGDGIAFSLSVHADREVVMHTFSGGSDGSVPNSTLAFGADGNLYGTSFQGGLKQAGTVFKLTKVDQASHWIETVIHTFHGTPYGSGLDGANPQAGVVFDSSGNLYGTTFYGGPAGYGTVFKLKPNQDGSWTESVLYAFGAVNDGIHPSAAVTIDQAGNLYGTTVLGGAGGYGTVFKLTPQLEGDWAETILHGFSGRLDGAWPGAAVVLDSAGRLYGTAVAGGTGGLEQAGVVFRLTP